MSTFIVILTKIKYIFLFVTTNTVLNITRFIREDISLIKKLEHGKMGKIWSINPLFAVTHKTDFFQLFALLL